MEILWEEIKKFLLINTKKILVSTLIFGTVLSIVFYVFNNQQEEQPVSIENIKEELDSSEEPFVYFQYYVELQDGRAYTNVSLAEEYFSHERIINELTNELGLPADSIFINKIQNNQTSTQETEDLDELFFIDINRDSETNLVTFVVNSSDKINNMKIAEFYFDLLESDEVEFYKNKVMFLFTRPTLNDTSEEPTSEIEVPSKELQSNMNILTVVSIFILSLVISVGVLIITTLFSKQLKYSFSYTWDTEDRFFLINSELSTSEEINWILEIPQEVSAIILTENKLTSDLSNKLNSKNARGRYKSLLDLNYYSPIQEVILIVCENSTSRKWYNEQQKLLSKKPDINVTVLQINE